jgi:CubicO group peptidase (beta-lactamase class C family)
MPSQDLLSLDSPQFSPMVALDVIQAAMNQAVQDGVFPGAVLAVRLRGSLRCLVPTGRLCRNPPGELVQTSTVYDLASLTKPLVTVTSLLLLVQGGKLLVDESIQKYLGELNGAPIGRATIGDLLTHSAGLPGWRPLYERLEARRVVKGRGQLSVTHQAVLQLIRDEPLIYERGARSLYSDLGFILLGLVIERITGLSLDRQYQKAVAGPLEAKPLLFAPMSAADSEISMECSVHRARIAPTEWDHRRGRLLQGEVHDENAAAMGGIAGHAGLFGTAESVLAITGVWLRAHRGQSSMLNGELVRAFTQRQIDVPQSSWALGWDTPSAPSSSGEYFSPESFGHLGYTGTSVWIDPQRELEVVLLSNRVCPSRKNDTIRAFRPRIHDLVFQEFVSSGR